MKNIRYGLLVSLLTITNISFGVEATVEPPVLQSRDLVDIEVYRKEVIGIQGEFKKFGQDKVSSLITLKTPLLLHEVVEFCENNLIDLQSVELYMVDIEGDIVVGEGSVKENLEMMDILLEEGQQILGVYILKGAIKTENIDDLQNNYHVYLVDITADSYFLGNGNSFGREMIN